MSKNALCVQSSSEAMKCVIMSITRAGEQVRIGMFVISKFHAQEHCAMFI